MLWCGLRVCEEREFSTGTIVERHFGLGFWRSTGSRYTTLDHLGSTRELTTESGALVARFDYDPYGRSTEVAGTESAARLFAGLYSMSSSDLLLARERIYSPTLGRWTSEDPIGFKGESLNLYSYVDERPTTAVDPTGLVGWNVDETAPPVEHKSAAEIQKICNGASPLCGCTNGKTGLRFKCSDDCSHTLSLSIEYHPTIYLADDILLPDRAILSHENGHNTDNIDVLKQAKIDGERWEGPYRTAQRCEDVGKNWQERWLGAMRARIRTRDTASLWRRLCGAALAAAGY
jgi:RHS repeat-associated protein